MPPPTEDLKRSHREERASDPQVDEERQARDVPPPRETLPDSENDQPKRTPRNVSLASMGKEATFARLRHSL